MPTNKPASAANIAFSVFAGLCLFAALACFLNGWGQIGAGANKTHGQEVQNRISSGMGSGDPIQNQTDKELADVDDREELAHGQFNVGVGVVLLVPAIALWRMGARHKS